MMLAHAKIENGENMNQQKLVSIKKFPWMKLTACVLPDLYDDIADLIVRIFGFFVVHTTATAIGTIFVETTAKVVITRAI